MTNEGFDRIGMRTESFDRIRAALWGLPDTKHTKPATILSTLPILDTLQTTVVETHRGKDTGFTVCLQIVESGVARTFVLPDKVTSAIYRQRAALTDRSTPESRKRAATKREREKQRRERAIRKAVRQGRTMVIPENPI